MLTEHDVDEKKAENISIVLFFLSVILAASAATQYAASRLNYQEALYWSILDFGGWKLYNPFAVFAWNGDYREQAPVLFINAYSIFGISTVVATMILVFIRLFFHKKTSDNYGSARFATHAELEKSDLLDGKGIILGLTDDGYYLRDDAKTHTFLCAPTRSGKGVGIIIPTLLAWPHSVVVVDVKGENYAFTAGRRKKMGQYVLKFEPTALSGSAGFNPLDEIRMGTPHEVKDCQNICRILADPTGKGYEGANAHWTSNAADLLFGIVLHLKWKEKDKPVNITSVLEFMASGKNGLRKLLNDIKEAVLADEIKHDDVGEILQYTNNESEKVYFHPRVYQVFVKMATTPEKEFGSIQSTLETALSVYRDPVVSANMKVSDFKIHDLMNSDRPVSLYLIVPPSDLDRLMPVFRVIVEILYRRNTEKMELSVSERKAVENKHRLLMLMDEFSLLGKLETFETSMGVIAGFGLKALIICQSVMQINKIYGKDNGIISNCEVQVYYAPNDQETAEQLARSLGKKTVETKSRSTGTALISLDKSRTYNETGRDLMMADEVRALDPKKELIFKRGMRPILANKITWYDNPDFMDLAEDAPAAPDIIKHGEKGWYKLAEEKFNYVQRRKEIEEERKVVEEAMKNAHSENNEVTNDMTMSPEDDE